MKFAWIVEAPFNFRKGDSLTGCDVELARAAFALLGEAFEPVESEFADLLAGLRDDRWDITTGMFVTAERRRHASFTVPIWSLQDALLVRVDDAEAISGYRDLATAGDKLAVLEGQVQHRTALELGLSSSNIVVFRHYGDAAEAVATGQVRAYASVALAHDDHIRHHSGFAGVPVPVRERSPELGAFACKNEEIRDRLDHVLNEIIGTERHHNLLRSFGLEPKALIPR